MESREETLEKNRRQKDFYNTKKKSLASRAWSFLRERSLKNIRKELGILEQCYALHKEWMGDLRDKKVLDLGCYSGNRLSRYMAENAREYVAIDLSDKGISRLQKKLEDIPTARAITIDFYSDDFDEGPFDLIYAYGVLHHFKDVDTLITRLKEKLAPSGRIISYDPLQTSTPVWIARTLYRPFQSDAAWEWPFRKSTVKAYREHFDVIETRGVLGRTKWYFLYQFLPLSNKWKRAWGKKAHQRDWERSSRSLKDLFICMQFNMLMEKK